MSSQQNLPQSSIPIFTTIAEYRAWRRRAFLENRTVGFVPTMGALHDGHLSLVRRSLQENDYTVTSIFVNPAQFAPHEDLATYPRTLPSDLKLLEQQFVKITTTASASGASKIQDAEVVVEETTRTPSAVFVPNVKEMYPSGIVQNVAEQKGTFVEVKGYGEQMEGKSRPTFFRGVATVVTKLFNAIEPTNAYFGQKDIQQALLLRRLCQDLLLSHPLPQNLHIVPTARDSVDNLALSSRNAYLTPSGRRFAPTLYQALSLAKAAWLEDGLNKKECIESAVRWIESKKAEWIQAKEAETEIKLDYIEMNDSESLEVIADEETVESGKKNRPVLLSGAMLVGKTRLIDNLILGDEGYIFGALGQR